MEPSWIQRESKPTVIASFMIIMGAGPLDMQRYDNRWLPPVYLAKRVVSGGSTRCFSSVIGKIGLILCSFSFFA